MPQPLKRDPRRWIGRATMATGALATMLLAVGFVFAVLAAAQTKDRNVAGIVALMSVPCSVMLWFCFVFLKRERLWAAVVSLTITSLLTVLFAAFAIRALRAAPGASGNEPFLFAAGLVLTTCALASVTVMLALTVREICIERSGRPRGFEPVMPAQPNDNVREK